MWRLALSGAIIALLVCQTPAKANPVAYPAITWAGQKGVTARLDSAAGVSLSPYWGPGIQQWAGAIETLAETHGFHPDFIAAIIQIETGQPVNSIAYGEQSRLMDVAAARSGLDWRASSQELLAPSINLRWGLAVLAHVVRQTGGDLSAALAAYNSGWNGIGRPVPREYAARVLDSYGRALAARAGISPALADRWTVAVEIRLGNIPLEPVLVAGDLPVSTSRYAAHTVYAYGDSNGQRFYIRGYAVPLYAPGLAGTEVTSSGQVAGTAPSPPGEKQIGGAAGNPRVILACLSSLNRLRGEVRTRWYSPAACPAVER